MSDVVGLQAVKVIAGDCEFVAHVFTGSRETNGFVIFGDSVEEVARVRQLQIFMQWPREWMLARMQSHIWQTAAGE